MSAIYHRKSPAENAPPAGWLHQELLQISHAQGGEGAGGAAGGFMLQVPWDPGIQLRR